MPRWTNLSLVGQGDSTHDHPPPHRIGEPRLDVGHAGGREHFAAGVAISPGGPDRLEGGQTGGIARDMQPAAGHQPGVDAGLVEEFGRPVAVQSIAPRGENFAGRLAGVPRGGRKDAGRRP